MMRSYHRELTCGLGWSIAGRGTRGILRPSGKKGWELLSEDDRVELNHAFANVGKAIAAYEMTLTSGASRFDTYARAVVSGDKEGQQDYSAQERLRTTPFHW